MKSSARAETSWELSGSRKDLESGDMRTGWWVMKVGETQCGSMKMEESLSRRRGMVGDVGNGSPCLSKTDNNKFSASGEVRSGSFSSRAFSRNGMKEMRLKGLENISGECTGRLLSGWTRSSETRVARPERRSSVIAMRSSRSAKDL